LYLLVPACTSCQDHRNFRITLSNEIFNELAFTSDSLYWVKKLISGLQWMKQKDKGAKYVPNAVCGAFG